ncbi:uncharacterized protein LOC126682541 isoform X2 [Mercurialis annua]|uniref:uncharacterized protein LOC126682541 isoform X2 n=1 Tax=Mercurialis annua TaxID=3986 RepID=UPI00215E9882|nr:uncharacterized protein LOC126682541 isoform X2 [Mercurialis annua]
MKKYNSSFTFFSFHILLFTIFICSPICKSQDTDGLCALAYCGEGICKNINISSIIPSFECECKPGWNKVQIGLVTFPSCLIPNCTVDLQCGNGSPPPPPPPIALPTLNFTDPCNLIWCGEGSCKPNANGTRHTCQCNEGSANLVNNTEMPCFQKCFLGADCNNLGLLPPAPPSPINSGPSKALSSWRSLPLGALIMIFLAATLA